MLREIARTYAKAETATILWVWAFANSVKCRNRTCISKLGNATGNLGKPNVE